LTREIGVSFFALITPLWPWFWRFVSIATAAIVVNLYWQSAKFLEIAGMAGLVGLIYLAVMFHPAQDSALGEYLRPRFTPVWRRLTSVRSAVP
jgi:hypothetical protein